MQYYRTLLLVLALFIVLALLLPETNRLSNIGLIGTSASSQQEAQYTKQSCDAGDKIPCTTPDGYSGFRSCDNGLYSQKCYIASLDECPINANQLASVCCRAKTGSIYACNGKTNFVQGQYVIVKTNLQMALKRSGLNISAYKACGFSKLKDAPSEVPSHYETSTEFSDTGTGVGCSPLLYSKDFHQASVDGFIPNTPGKIKIVEWRVYPDTVKLSDAADAVTKIEASTPVYTFEVNIGA